MANTAIFFGLLGSFFWAALSGDQLAAQAVIHRNTGLFFLLLFASGFLSLAFYCALIRLIHDRYVNPRVSVIAACMAGAKRFLPVVGLLLIYFLAYVALYLAVLAVGLALSMMVPPSIVILLTVALGIFFLYLIFPYLLSLVICVNEDLGPIRSLGRSRYLSAGYRWPLFGMILLTWVIWLGYVLITNFLTWAFGPAGGIVVLILMLLVVPLMYAWMIGIYSIAAYRLRVLKDGIDLSGTVADVFD